MSRQADAATMGPEFGTQPAGAAAIVVRGLTAEDLEPVVDIDRRHSGLSRHGFYQKRLNAALRNPKAFIYVGACEGDRLVGFALARLLGGEFGAEGTAAVLDAIGVDPDQQGRGIGGALIAGLDDVMRRKGIRELQTQSEWTDARQLRFFEHLGFRIAPRIILERAATPLRDD